LSWGGGGGGLEFGWLGEGGGPVLSEEFVGGGLAGRHLAEEACGDVV
jgi:hypothetical protein